MPVDQPEALDPFEQFARLRAFSGAPAEFWKAFLEAATRLAASELGVLVLKGAETGAPWRKLAQWSQASPDRGGLAFLRHLIELADRASAEGIALVPLERSEGHPAGAFAASVRLQFHAGAEVCVGVFYLPGLSETEARERLTRLRLVADVPASFQLRAQMDQARADVDKVAGTLELNEQVNRETRFVAAALALCNGVAARHQCDRVSLGWADHGYARLAAISRTEKFDRQMAALRSLEQAMEECLDQDDEVVWPPPSGATTVSRDHDSFARTQGLAHVCSIPLRLEQRVVGVVTCERQSHAFAETELRQLRLAVDQVVRRLSDLRRVDRWFGARWIAAAREKAASWVGVEHTWSKVAAILIAIAFVVLLTVRVDYRVEAKFILHSDEVAYIATPFEGFIDRVEVRVGEPVTQNQVLLSLAKEQLELDESSSIADLTRYSREAEKARAANYLADMRIALALADQSRARLEMVRYRLGQSSLRAPFAGFVVEGDQKERIGAPVRAGDVLFKIARSDVLFVEADVNERDVHEIKAASRGEIAFASQPKFKFPIQVERVRVAAQPKEGENVFVTRCTVQSLPESWWRPGMSGVCKIEAGRRTLLWILSHRTLDYLRLLLWW